MVTSARPLRGTRVVDLTRFVSGSYATMLLGALGAEVLKVETPPHGDSYRSQGLVQAGDSSTLFESLNRGKRSVALDFRDAAGATALELLLGGSDFYVHNARPGSLDRYGLDSAAVLDRHPGIVCAAISAFGDVGPDATRGGFDLIVQAESGLMGVTGSVESGPVKVGAPVLDIGAGLAAVAGLLAAHIDRLRTGQGSIVASSLLEFALAGLTTLAADALATGTSPPLLGSHSPSFAPYGAFKASDGHLVIAGAGSEHLWSKLCDVIGRNDLVDDPRFIDNASRVQHRDELGAQIEASLVTADVHTWLARFDRAGVPAGTVKTIADVLASDQIAALDAVRQPVGSTQASAVDPPFRFGSERPTLGPAPGMGADTRNVLEELGAPSSLIDQVLSAGGAD